MSLDHIAVDGISSLTSWGALLAALFFVGSVVAVSVLA